MITTNKTQPKSKDEDLKLRVLTTNTVKPKEFDFQPRDYGGFIKKETRKPARGMITQVNLEKRQRNSLRRQLMEKRKRIMAETHTQERATLAAESAAPLMDEIKPPEKPDVDISTKDLDTLKEKKESKKSSRRKSSSKEEDEE